MVLYQVSLKLFGGSGEEEENVKSLWQQRRPSWRTTDKLWSEKLTWAFSTGELTTPGTKWAKRFH